MHLTLPIAQEGMSLPSRYACRTVAILLGLIYILENSDQLKTQTIEALRNFKLHLQKRTAALK